MSAASKKKRAGRKKEEKPEHARSKEAMKPTGTPPSAVVEVRHGGQMIQRPANGYSWGEVTQAGLGIGAARRWGLRVDDRRRSALGANVVSLKKWAAHSKVTTEGRIEGELRKIEQAVKKEVHKAEEEVEKVGKEAKEEVEKVEKGAKEEVEKVERKAKKVEKEVVEKVEAPIKKRSKKKASAKSKTTDKRSQKSSQ